MTEGETGMTEGDSTKTFTVTLPRVGVGLQSGTLALVLWLGGQADTFVDELTAGFDTLVDRVSALEDKVGIDPKARAAAVETEARNVEQDEIIAELVNRVEKLEECQGKKKCI